MPVPERAARNQDPRGVFTRAYALLEPLHGQYSTNHSKITTPVIPLVGALDLSMKTNTLEKYPYQMRNKLVL
jgi:hypothetical protein